MLEDVQGQPITLACLPSCLPADTRGQARENTRRRIQDEQARKSSLMSARKVRNRVGKPERMQGGREPGEGIGAAGRHGSMENLD